MPSEVTLRQVDLLSRQIGFLAERCPAGEVHPVDMEKIGSSLAAVRESSPDHPQVGVYIGSIVELTKRMCREPVADPSRASLYKAVCDRMRDLRIVLQFHQKEPRVHG
jgi:hypothetical protein